MKDIITDREDLFWAKMAGRDVDLSTWTPPVATNMREKLMLETAERIAGGGGDEETVTINYEIGNVPETSDGYIVELEDARFAKITRKSNVVINGHEMVVVADTDKIEFTYNLDPSGEPTGTPAIYFEVDGAAITYITDVDPSNSTLSIVVTNETGGSGSLPDPGTAGNVLTSTGSGWESAAPSGGDVIVTATLGSLESFPNMTITQPSMSAAEIIDSNKVVKLIAKDESEQIWFIASLAVIANGTATFLGYLFYGEILRYVASAEVADGDNETTVRLLANQLPPIPTIPDEGRILGVANGNYLLIDNNIPLFVQGTWASGTPNTVTITTPLADIYEAAQTNGVVYLEYSEDGVTTRMSLVTYENDNGAYKLGFSACTAMSDKPAVVTVAFDNSLVGVFGIVVGQ